MNLFFLPFGVAEKPGVPSSQIGPIARHRHAVPSKNFRLRQLTEVPPHTFKGGLPLYFTRVD